MINEDIHNWSDPRTGMHYTKDLDGNWIRNNFKRPEHGTITVMKTRKAIQILMHPGGKQVFALCDDGTIWFISEDQEESHKNGWRQTCPIPQPE